jgi:hypothetical protein
MKEVAPMKAKKVFGANIFYMPTINNKTSQRLKREESSKDGTQISSD